MVKHIKIAALLCLVAAMFTACSPSEEAFTCDFCGREITGTSTSWK